MFLSKRFGCRVEHYVALALSISTVTLFYEFPAAAQGGSSLLPPINSNVPVQLRTQGQLRSTPLPPGSGTHFNADSSSVFLWGDQFCNIRTPVQFNCSNELEEYRQHRTQFNSDISPKLTAYLERMGITFEEFMQTHFLIQPEDGYANECLFLEEDSDEVQMQSLTRPSTNGENTYARYYSIRITIPPNSTMGIGEWYLVSCSIPSNDVIPSLIAGIFPDLTAAQAIAQANEQVEEIVLSEEIPCDDEELQTTYDSSSPSYHYYDDIENEVCSLSSVGCTADFVFSTMISQVRFVAPTTDARTPVLNCQENALNLPGPWGVDSIRTIVDPTNRSVTNYTKLDHVLHPGRATRTVVERDSSIYVVTIGEGNGGFPGPNEFFASGTWFTEGFNDVDRLLIQEVNRRLPSPEIPSNQQF